MHPAQLRALTVIGFLVVSTQAFGQTDNVVETVQQSITTQARNWETVLMQHATSLFWILAAIEVGIAAVWLAIQGSTLESFFSELVRRILFIGFFLFVLTNGPDLAKAVVSSLFQIGSGSGDVSPAAVFDAGIDVANRMTQQLAWWNPGDFGKNVIVGVCALAVKGSCCFVGGSANAARFSAREPSAGRFCSRWGADGGGPGANPAAISTTVGNLS